jgi:hypothetical protein
LFGKHGYSARFKKFTRIHGIPDPRWVSAGLQRTGTPLGVYMVGDIMKVPGSPEVYPPIIISFSGIVL